MTLWQHLLLVIVHTETLIANYRITDKVILLPRQFIAVGAGGCQLLIGNIQAL